MKWNKMKMKNNQKEVVWYEEDENNFRKCRQKFTLWSKIRSDDSLPHNLTIYKNLFQKKKQRKQVSIIEREVVIIERGILFSEWNVDLRIPIVGMIQSLFEGSMYTFVFMWTPTLADVAEVIHLFIKLRNSFIHSLRN